MKLEFLGAAGTVTGSKFLVSAGDTRVLVDCGLYQGLKQLRLRNWAPLPVEPASLDAVVLTHAHLDHSGQLPVLVKQGFRGPVYCTRPTVDLCGILLPDSGHLHEEDARYANRKRFSKHDPALPLYTEDEARAVLPQLRPVDFGESLAVGDLSLRLQPAGHILGTGGVLVSDGARSVLFSGDLGRCDDLLMRPPEPPGEPDWVVMESTYGDRQHADLDPIGLVADVLTRTHARGGTLLVPAFAVGRAQTLLYCLHEVFRRELAPEVPVFVNSPMATDVTELYTRHVDYHRLSVEQCASVCDVATYTRSVDESRKLSALRGRMVILSASGMATGGRVLHHLKTVAPDEHNTILLPGFQAPGTRGDSLANGAGSIKIHGEYVRVRAEVLRVDGFSAHADQSQLLDWVGRCERRPRGVLLVHGEPRGADVLRRRIADEHGFPVRVAEYRETVEL
ncbi:MAG: MBL fold metallo-hydrolase [Myxococcota bacterium]|nr:MBL fold metallo-hydrolase [Myxococcota bacterium]